ncbi:MAG: hypothetical protein L3J54_07520, partial [Draconibacterium sp.]|nr:hypothetical protein [Draconibacterium sp.]
MEYKELQKFIEALVKTGAPEIKIETEEMRIIVRNELKVSQLPATVSTVTPAVQPAQSTPQPPEAPQEENVATEEKSNYIEIKSPMVGTFYRKPAPDKPAYVNIGDDIRAEGLLIEADNYQLPSNFYILEPSTPKERLKNMVQNDAEIRHLGTEKKTHRRYRPAQIAVKNSLEGNIAVEIIHKHCSLIRHNKASNPIIEWAAHLFDGLHNDRLTLIIDRHNIGTDALVNSPIQLHDKFWQSEASYQYSVKNPA